jgi:hypothetical protein
MRLLFAGFEVVFTLLTLSVLRVFVKETIGTWCFSLGASFGFFWSRSRGKDS